MNTSDYIALAALVVSAYAVFQSHLTNKRSEAAQREARATVEAAERQRLADQVILEAAGLSDDVRLHGGVVAKTKKRAKEIEISSDSQENAGIALVIFNCDGKRIEAEDSLTKLAQPVLSGGEDDLRKQPTEELRTLLRKLQQARYRVEVLSKETVALLAENRAS